MAKTERWKKAGGRTLDLTKKQVASGRRVGKAGRSKVTQAEAKKARKSVDIGATTWRKASERTGPRARGGVLVDRSGKPVTGTVTLASGRKATYVRGKRVAAAKKTAAPRGGNGGGNGGGRGGSRTGASSSASNTWSTAQRNAFNSQRPASNARMSAQQVAAAARQRRRKRRVNEPPNRTRTTRTQNNTQSDPLMRAGNAVWNRLSYWHNR